MVVPVLVLAVVLVLDPPSVVVLLFTGPLLLLLLVVIGGRTRAVSERRFLEMRVLSAFFLDLLRGLPTLRLFGRSREQVETLRRISGRYGDATMDVLRTAFQTSLVLEWGATIAIALVAVEVGLRLLEDGIAFDRALAVLLIAPEFFLPLRLLAVRFHLGTAGKAAMARAFEILDAPVSPSAPAHARHGGRLVRACGRVDAHDPARVRRGGRAAGGAGRPTRAPLRGSGLPIPGPGTAGPHGREPRDRPPGAPWRSSVPAGRASPRPPAWCCGSRNRPPGGSTLDGRPLADRSISDWRASLAWVPQRPHLFSGSVADNIRLARPHAADAAVRAAARAANAEDFIERLPQGYETAVGEGGARLSGGQRQRIAIARAFLRDAPLLVLDEPTSYQDEASEAAIAEAIDRLTAGRTVLVIAHRLRLAERAERVVVLEAGRVVEEGPATELRARRGPYARLVEAQAEVAALSDGQAGPGETDGPVTGWPA